MSSHIDLGKEGEEIACDYLLHKGYTLLDRNYRFQKAEVDLIFKDGSQLVFVEVKTRESSYLVEPRLLISRSKQKQIVKASDFYLKDKELDLESRFDVVIIVLNSTEKSLNHIANAFTPIG